MGNNALGLEDLVTAMPDAAAVLNRHGVVVVANEPWHQVTHEIAQLHPFPPIMAAADLGVVLQEPMEGENLLSIIGRRSASGIPFQNVMMGHCAEAVERFTFSQPAADGESSSRMIDVRVVEIGDGSDYVLASCRDVMILPPPVVIETPAPVSADRHPLTGLPGRRLFMELLNQAMTMSDRHRYFPAAMSIAMHGLAEVEQRHGEQVRDELLVAIVSRMKAGLRPGDVVAQITEDQFAVMLPDVYGVEVGEGVAHRLGAEVARPFRLDGAIAEVKMFVGVAGSADASTAEAVLGAAEVAMVEALDSDAAYASDGPAKRVVVAGGAEGLNGQGERHINVADLRDEELVSYFQPIFDVTTGEVVAGEALMRWRHPHYGVLSAGEFLGLAINHGLLATLTDQALVRSAETWADIRDSLGPNPPQLFINLSPEQLLSRTAVDRLHHLLVATGLPADDVVVEVTEEAMSTRFDEMLTVLNELRDHGLRVALDDFGSGYSSLGRLRHLPVDVIKVDQTMVRDLETDMRARQLLKAVSTMVKELDVDCIVEGIETPGEAAIVAELGFRFVQGYHFGKPVPADEFVGLVVPRVRV